MFLGILCGLTVNVVLLECGSVRLLTPPSPNRMTHCPPPPPTHLVHVFNPLLVHETERTAKDVQYAVSDAAKDAKHAIKVK